MNQDIILKNVTENNLKNVDIVIPKNKLVVLTGISGSGKSSIAFNTVHQECQYEYMESIGAASEIARPKIGSISGLSPSICVNQNASRFNPRSTVGTLSDVFTYLRLIYAKLGEIKCECGQSLFSDIKRCKNEKIENVHDFEEEDYSDDSLICQNCGKSHVPLTMAHFSFNKPEGACQKCSGLGYIHTISIEKIINPSLRLFEGAVMFLPVSDMNWMTVVLENASRHYGFTFDVNAPVKDFCKPLKYLLLYGVYDKRFIEFFPTVPIARNREEGRYEGVVNMLMRRHEERINDDEYRERLESFMVYQKCPECDGYRLSKTSRNVFVNSLDITQVSSLSLFGLSRWIDDLLTKIDEDVFRAFQLVFDEIKLKVSRLVDIGLGYLNLMRCSSTLSMGEIRRIKLSSLIGSNLTGLIYILDEPTIGLHQRDTGNLIKVLKQLRDVGNTVLVVEHDIEVIHEADHIIEVGPLAGINGGNIIAQGSPEDIIQSDSITGRYMANPNSIATPLKRRKGNGKFIEIIGAKKHNLKNINVTFALGTMIGVTGVSGSGKSTLIFDIFKEVAEKYFSGNSMEVEGVEKIEGLEFISRVVTIDQAPIGLTPRSNIMTYTGIYTLIRQLYSKLPSAVEKNLTPGHFSFNIRGGRCERCQGAGAIEINMHFTQNSEIKCPLCHGKRFKKNILECLYKGYSISDVLDLTVDEAYEVFNENKSIQNKLKFLQTVGLGYIRIGQTATTLSGGEAQRIKLSKELSKKEKSSSLYILDEPTTGLHQYDIQKFIHVLNQLVDNGNTVVVIEHNLDVIKCCDGLLDIGPEGGEYGGFIIAEGTPEQVALVGKSITGRYLQKLI